jgi:hypothetical protein
MSEVNKSAVICSGIVALGFGTQLYIRHNHTRIHHTGSVILWNQLTT